MEKIRRPGRSTVDDVPTTGRNGKGRPVDMPVEVYTPERRAEFLLTNAVDDADYADAVTEVRDAGLDPATIPHLRPG